MSTGTFDCYLCGTGNPPDASFCQSCSGQLLKLPDSVEPNEPSAEPFQVDKASEAEMSLEEQFGDVAAQAPIPETLGSPEATSGSDIDFGTDFATPQLPVPEVVAENVASDAGHLESGGSSIPQIGLPEYVPNTKAAPTPTSGKDGEVGKVAYVFVGLLFAATALFGFNTLFGESERVSPESIGFVDSTTTIARSDSAEPVESTEVVLDARDVNSAFSPAIVRVIPYTCASGTGEALAEATTGIALDEQTIILGPTIPPGTDTVQIFSRTGASRVGIVTRQAGVLLATSINRTTRHLDIVDTADEADFFVGYDFESNDISTTESPQGLDAEIAVSSAGHVHEISIGSLTIPAETLAGIDLSVQPKDDAAVRSSVCALSNSLEFVSTGAPTEETTDGELEEATDADLEEVDAG